MPPPPLIAAFEKFNQQIPNHLEASIAFGLYMTSLREAASGEEASEAKYRNLQQAFLTDHEVGRYRDSAKQLLSDFGNGIVATKRAEFLQQALAEYRNEASRGHRKFRLRGVLEAVAGAFIWTGLLIVISVYAARSGIDLLEIYRRAIGTAH